MIKRILLCILAGMSLTATAAPPTAGSPAGKIDERMLLKRRPAPEPTKDAKPYNPFKAPVRVNPMKTLSPSSFYGVVMTSSDWTEYFMNRVDPPYGVYSFPKEIDDTATAEMLDPIFSKAVSGFYMENTYYVMTQTVSYENGQILYDLYAIDTDSWKISRHVEINDHTYGSPDMTYNPADGFVYGSFYNSNISGFNFACFDPVTLDYQVIAPIADRVRYIAIAADNEGNIYAVNELGDFLTVDPDTGEETVVGPTGIEPSQYLQSMTWDPASGNLYWVGVLPTSISLYVINPADGLAQEIAPMPANEEVVGMFIPFRESADNAPSQITDLEATFPEGALSGNVTFTLPATDNVGNALSGELGYVVNINGIDKARGTGNAGEAIVIDANIEVGETTIEVRASNNAGNSPVARAIFWAGADTPKAVENLTLKNENGNAVLTWTLPEGGIHDGYVDSTATTFEIVRHPGDVILAQAHGEQTYTDQMQDVDIDLYSYSVTPVYAGNHGATSTSERIMFGEASSVPYFDGMDNETRFNSMYTTVDSNNDGITWSFFRNAWQGFDKESGAADLRATEDGNDDWLISSPIKLNARIDYLLNVQMAGGRYTLDFYNSVFEIYISTSPEVETFNTKLDFENEIIDIDSFYQQLNSIFSVECDGTYYIAYHGIGQQDEEASFYHMLIDWVKLDELSNFNAPAKISDLSVDADANGELSATVDFTAPSSTYKGDALNEITGIDISRDGVIVKSFDNVEPGAPLSFIDNGLEEGMRSYTVAARNSYGRSIEATDSVYVGHDTPAKVTGIKTTDEGNEIHLSWQPVSTGVNGGYVDADAVSYVITNPEGSILAEGITATEWSEEVEVEGKMVTHIYNVAAVYDGKTGEEGIGDGVVTGTPLNTPFHESFAEGKYQNEGWWDTHDTNAYGGYEYKFKPLHNSSSDSDHEAISFEGKNYWDSPNGINATLNTGKISLREVENPALFFWYQGFAYESEIILEVYVNDCGRTTEKVHEIVIAHGENMDAYNKVEVPLTQFARHDYVYVSFRAHTLDSYWAGIAIDDIYVRNVYDNNLTVDMQLPPNFFTGVSNDLPVILHNTGKSPIAAGYKVSVKQNGNELTTIDGPELQSDDKKIIMVDIKPGVAVGDEFELSVEADYADDLNADNIIVKTVQTVNAELPMATQPTAADNAEGTMISWQQPDMSEVGPTLEDFESYEPFIHDAFGQWLSVDMDKEIDLGDARMAFPDMDSPSSFFTFNPYVINEDFMEIAPEYEPHSGEQYLANYNVAYGYAEHFDSNNDWLISPRLSGRAQTIAFYAKALESYEMFQLLYSMTGTDVTDFIAVSKTPFSINNEWDKVEFEIPEGAKYFAIQSTSHDTWALFIDDITYEGLCDWLEPAGFNVYRDGKLIGTTDAATCYFVDTQAPDKCTYSVTALYNVGESAPASVDFDRSGIAAIDGSLKVLTADDAILIRGGEGLKARVYSIDGMLVAAATLDGDTRIAVTPGVYVVETGDFRTKVIVR